MATSYSAINMTAYNMNQVRTAAANLGIMYHATDSVPALVAKVKAK